ncbi:Ca-activated chloride channel family protein [Methylomagnum ishizawai]|uniref:Ca-activated chloride channel family protein n=1 Tax=Methylomagnum ishizawai TaxID=1760988 RepID=A0A1Y6D2J9_9GAMM|nr:VWA domain-containing protein [Methylomagnum ishizawai]SMF97168.1 Ca-activated chloride channel family protein [Methylomagnum ishizawai]
MIDFAWFWMLLALPLPWLVYRLLPPVEDAAGAALRTPFLDELDGLPNAQRNTGTPTARLWMAALAWALLVVAAARPVWLGDPIEQAVSGRDLLLAVDLSGSMEMQDFVLEGKPVDRLTATQAVAGQFIERRVGDRLGLILFGERAYLQAPLTFDRKTVETLLDEAAIGLAGDKTAIGDAIGLAVKRLRDNPAGQRVLILLSDGANTAGTVAPLQAADLAARAGLKIYTIGIGADEMVLRDPFFGSRRVNPSKDLDEPTMRGIAEKTGGRYFRARDMAEFEEIYRLLDQLEPVERDKRYYRPHTELYPWPLGVALLVATGLGIWMNRGQP